MDGPLLLEGVAPDGTVVAESTTTTTAAAGGSVLNTDTIIVMSYTAIGVITLVVGLRMYVRLKILRIFGAEDWAMVATFLFAIAQLSFTIVNCKEAILLYGGNQEQLDRFEALVRASGFFYVLTLIGLKLSLGYFFVHIFSHKKAQKTVVHGIMIVSTVVGLAYMPVGYGTCATIKPLPTIQTTCSDATQLAASVLYGLFSIVNIGSDFILTTMALMALSAAQLPRPTKISAGVLLALGSAGGVASLVRWVFVLEPTNTSNATEALTLLLRWVVLELALGVTAANLAMTKPLFTALMVKLGAIGVKESTDGPLSTHGWSAAASAVVAAKRATGASDASYPRNDHLLEDIQKRVSIQVDEEMGEGGQLGTSWFVDGTRAAVPRGL